MSLHQDENLQKRCKIMVQKEDPQKKAVLPESEPSDLLHRPSFSPSQTPAVWGGNSPEQCWGFHPQSSEATCPALHPSCQIVRGDGPPPCTHWRTQFSPGITLPQAGQYPLWQVPAGLDGQGQPHGFVYVHSPCLPDLHNWKNNMPSYCDGPKGMETLSTSIFATHHPNGADT